VVNLRLELKAVEELLALLHENPLSALWLFVIRWVVQDLLKPFLEFLFISAKLHRLIRKPGHLLIGDLL